MATTANPPKPQQDTGDAAAPRRPAPRLGEGIELIGEYDGSGFKEAPYIARRADGQVIQLTYLLHLVATAVDGRRGYREIAAEVSEQFGRRVSAGNVQFLVEKQLRPLGVLAAADGSTPRPKKSDPLLALKFRVALVPERAVQPVTTLFKPLFLPPIVVAVLAGIVALDVWLFFMHGLGAGVRGAVYQPVLLVLFFGLIVVATAFHEIGHASACRYGGARPGVLGAGIYVVWPVFYCDVTDAYRLNKVGRLRTDLGGVYFNVIFALIMSGSTSRRVRADPARGAASALRDSPAAHAAAAPRRLLHHERSHGRARHPHPDPADPPQPRAGPQAEDKVNELKPWVRVVVSGYVLIAHPRPAIAVVLMLLSAPSVFATAYDSIGVQYDKVGDALDGGKGFNVAAGVLQIAAVALPCLGMMFTTGRHRLAGGPRSVVVVG